MGTGPELADALFRLLAHGRPVHLSDLARRLAVSPAVITDRLLHWQAEGLPVLGRVEGAPRLASSFEPLDRRRIRAALTPPTRARQKRLDCHAEVDSTNQVLLDRARHGPIDGHLCLAEHQQAGRGRHGRRWAMPWGAGLCMSLGLDLRPGKSLSPACLGIAAGVGAVRAIRSAGLDAAGLKWPNDIMFDDKKLGGILVETRLGPGGRGTAVIGIGINVAWPAGSMRDVGQPCTDVRTASGREVSRNALAAAVISEVMDVLQTVADHGFGALQTAWAAYDMLIGRPIRVMSPEGVVTGVARRLDPTGALVVATGETLRRFHSGEVSLRL